MPAARPPARGAEPFPAVLSPYPHSFHLCAKGRGAEGEILLEGPFLEPSPTRSPQQRVHPPPHTHTQPPDGAESHGQGLGRAAPPRPAPHLITTLFPFTSTLSRVSLLERDMAAAAAIRTLRLPPAF